MENIYKGKKKLYQQKIDLLSSLSAQFDFLNKQIEDETKISKTSDDDLLVQHKLHHEESIAFANKRKAIFLKLINFNKNGFSVYTNKIKFESKIDSLIKCILDVNSKQYSKFNTYDIDDVTLTNRDNDSLNKIKTIKDELASGPININQSLIDKICCKLIELKYVDKDILGKCILFQNLDNADILEKKICIYESCDNFLILVPENDQRSVNEKSNTIINNLIHEEVLPELCEYVYTRHAKCNFSEADIKLLMECYKFINKSQLNNEEQEKVFLLDLISYLKDENDIFVEIINHQLVQLSDYFNNLEQFTEEHDSLKDGINFFKQMFIKRMLCILNDQIDLRKNSAKKSIKRELQLNKVVNDQMVAFNEKLDNIEKQMIQKNIYLTDLNVRIAERKEQFNLLEESFAGQNSELENEIANMEESLKQREVEYNMLKEKETIDAKELDKVEKEIDSIRKQKDEMQKKANELTLKKSELTKTINNLIKDKNLISNEISKFEIEKRFIDNERKEIQNELNNTSLWSTFIQSVYDLFLNDMELYKKRASIKKRLDSSQNLLEYCKVLIEELNMDKHILDIARENSANRKNEITSSLKNILADPSVSFSRDKLNNQTMVEITGLNLNYDEACDFLKKSIEKELEKFDLKFDSNGHLTIDNLCFYKNFLAETFEIEESFKKLIDRHVKQSFYFESIKENKKGFLSPEVLVHDEKSLSQISENNKLKNYGKELGEIKLSEMLTNFKITYDQVLKCFAKSIKCIAGNNLYVNSKQIVLHGVNLALIAGKDIELTAGLQLDTSGDNAKKFKYEQAFSFSQISKTANSMQKHGRKGVDGLDGFCGENGGHIYLKSENQIKNLELIDLIKTSGGNGGEGQKGGNGQNGSKGQDIGDAKAEDFGICILYPGFSAAFAREPGFSLETGKFDEKSELSGDGGDSGDPGYGGQEGSFGEITIVDCDDQLTTKNNSNDEEILCFSASLKPFVEDLKKKNKMFMSSGKRGENATTDLVKGGEAGEPGSYGFDNVIYVDGLFSGRKNLKGDYSNYLDQNPNANSADDLFGRESIFKSPDMYAVMSYTYKTFHIGLSFISLLATPLACFLILGAIYMVETVTGLIFEYKLKNRIKNKNHKGEIFFKNRYCDRKPNGSDKSTMRRTNEKSRGKKGTISQSKKESTRQEHSMPSQHNNMFTDPTENTLNIQKTKELSVDVAKNEIVDHLNKEIAIQSENSAKLESSAEQLSKKINESENKLKSIDNTMEQTQIEKKNIDSQLEKTNNMINQLEQEQSLLGNQLIASSQSLLSTMKQKTEKQVEIEVNLLEIKSKVSVKNEISNCFIGLKTELEVDAKRMANEKINAEAQMQKLNQEKNNIVQKIQSLETDKLNAIKNQAELEKEIKQLTVMQQNLQDESKNETSTNLTEETMISKDFQKVSVNEKIISNEVISITKRRIDEKKYKKLFSGMLSKVKIGYPSLKSLCSKVKSLNELDSNEMLGKLEFLIEASELDFSKYDEKIAKKVEPKKMFKEIDEKPNSIVHFYDLLANIYFKSSEIKFYDRDNEADVFTQLSLKVFYDHKEKLDKDEEQLALFLNENRNNFYGK